MKKNILFLLFILSINIVFSQTAPPQGINYQAVVYVPYSNKQPGVNNEIQVPANKQDVQVQFTIEDGNNGPIIYEENQVETTDEFGLLNATIGQGIASVNSPGSFSQISWGTTEPYLRVSIKLIETNTTISSYQKLWSVPYSLFSKKADYANIAGNGIKTVIDNGNGTLTFEYFDGSTYTTPVLAGLQGSASSMGAWSTTGNASTDSTLNFLGTTDSLPLLIKTNSLERLRVTSNGKIGIGTSNPLHSLSIKDNFSTTTPFGISDNSNLSRFELDFEGDSTTAYTNIQFNVFPKTSSDQATIRFFRRTNTTGPKAIYFLRGNNTTQGSAKIGVDGETSYFQNHGGNFGIGTAIPSGKFHVNNDISGSDSSFIVTDRGFIGIGTSMPTQKLEINGGGVLINSNYGIGFNARPYYDNSSNGEEGSKIYSDNTITTDPNKDFLVIEKKDGNTNTPDGGIVFTNAGNNGGRSVSMMISGTGNVGVGNFNNNLPTSKLHLISNDGLNLSFKVNDAVNYAEIQTNKSGGSNLILQGSGGSVGVGTTSPQRILHVNSVMRLEPIPTAPTSPGKGDMYFDSTLNKLRVYDGTTWQNCW